MARRLEDFSGYQAIGRQVVDEQYAGALAKRRQLNGEEGEFSASGGRAVADLGLGDRLAENGVETAQAFLFARFVVSTAVTMTSLG